MEPSYQFQLSECFYEDPEMFKLLIGIGGEEIIFTETPRYLNREGSPILRLCSH